jgi:hypothetical protein
MHRMVGRIQQGNEALLPLPDRTAKVFICAVVLLRHHSRSPTQPAKSCTRALTRMPIKICPLGKCSY